MPLHIVSTPIGNLKDITLRSLETLKDADLILCEDTRVTQRLLGHYGIKKSLLVYNDFKTPHERIIQELQEGKNLVLVSDAGTPLMSDPGYKLIQECQKYGIKMTAEPGASAILTALVLSGLPPYPFYFGGFFDPKKSDLSVKATLVFFEAPHRLLKTLEVLNNTTRTIAVARELTKMYEEVQVGRAEKLIEHFKKHPPKGEIVLVLGPDIAREVSLNLDEDIKRILSTHSLNDASKILSQIHGIPKKEVYKKALELSKK